MEKKMFDENKLMELANLDIESICRSEEDIKLKFIVPLLEALGHERIMFEVKGADIIVKNSINSYIMLVEAKHWRRNLIDYIPQLARYSKKHNPILAVLCNGKEILIFHPSWFRRKFKDTILFRIRKSDIYKKRQILIDILSAESLATGKIRHNLIEYEVYHDESVENSDVGRQPPKASVISGYSSAEVLDYVNYYGLIRGKQIMFCTDRINAVNLILWCKGVKNSLKYGLSREGKAYLAKLPNFVSSSYIADVELIALRSNDLKMWERLYIEKLFPFWDPMTGPFDFNKTPNRIAVCRVYKINLCINEKDISQGQTHRSVRKKMIISINNALLNKRAILSDASFKKIKSRIYEIVMGYT